MKIKYQETTPAWIPCPNGCQDYFCTIHNEHTHVCDCPSIDHWLTDPYTPALVDDPQSEIHYREKTKKIALDVLNFISLFVSEHGYMPSRRDIAAKFSTSTSVINRYLDVLAEFNMIELTDGIARGIKILIQRKS